MVRKLVALPSLAVCLMAAVAFADPPAPPPDAPTQKAEAPAAKAEAPDVLVVGDSQAQGVAGALIRRYLRSKDFHVVDKSKIGTGLYSKSTYDWDAVVAELATTEHAKVAVVMFGANDRPPVRIKGVVDPGLSEKFSKTYGARVEKIVKSLRDAKIDVVWLGDPVVKDADYSADMQMLNQVMEPVAEKEGAKWVSLWDLGVAADGSYDAFGKALDGQTKRLRADDGVLVPRRELLAPGVEPEMDGDPLAVVAVGVDRAGVAQPRVVEPELHDLHVRGAGGPGVGRILAGVGDHRHRLEGGDRVGHGRVVVPGLLQRLPPEVLAARPPHDRPLVGLPFGRGSQHRHESSRGR